MFIDVYNDWSNQLDEWFVTDNSMGWMIYSRLSMKISFKFFSTGVRISSFDRYGRSIKAGGGCHKNFIFPRGMITERGKEKILIRSRWVQKRLRTVKEKRECTFQDRRRLPLGYLPPIHPQKKSVCLSVYTSFRESRICPKNRKRNAEREMKNWCNK